MVQEKKVLPGMRLGSKSLLYIVCIVRKVCYVLKGAKRAEDVLVLDVLCVCVCVCSRGFTGSSWPPQQEIEHQKQVYL